jgi:hypothetical protein
MAQIGEPDVEPGGAEVIRHPCVQPEAVVREGPVHEKDRGTAIAMGAQAM